MKNVVPFRAPEPFRKLGIDWTRIAASERERSLREAYLTYETSCGPNGLVSVILLAAVSRRQGAVARDLQDAAEFAETLLAIKLRTHQEFALKTVQLHLAEVGPVWS